MDLRAELKKLQKRAANATQFLPENLVMLDCEMTGVVPERDALLQVAMLKLKWAGNKYAAYDEPLVAYLHYEGQPETEFHKKYLSHIFKKCNASDLTPEKLKAQIHQWLGDLKGTVTPVGDCVPTDVSFLYAKGCADRPDISKDGKQIPGTFYYEFFDMNAAKALARQKVGEKFKVPGMDEENIHDALVDCKNQLLELNKFIEVLLT